MGGPGGNRRSEYWRLRAEYAAKRATEQVTRQGRVFRLTVGTEGHWVSAEELIELARQIAAALAAGGAGAAPREG